MSNRSKSRKKTPWDGLNELTETQEFLQMHYVRRYDERHSKLIDTGEAKMINSFAPDLCPFCHTDQFVKIGFDPNGIQRYKCQCGNSFKPTTGTIFDSRRLGICEWIEYCLNIFRYVRNLKEIN
jgi:hypothetical protein